MFLGFLFWVSAGLAGPAYQLAPASAQREGEWDPQALIRFAQEAEAHGDLSQARAAYERSLRPWLNEEPMPRITPKGPAWAHTQALAFHRLGTMLRRGEGGPPDPQRAAMVWVHALPISSVGVSRAYLELAELYEQGLGVPRDVSFARELREGFVQSVGEAKTLREDILLAARMKERGEGLNPDLPTALWDAFRLYQRAREKEGARRVLEALAARGHSEAELSLGMAFQGGDKDLGIAPDPSKAPKHFRRAASLGSVSGWGYLGRLYQAGLGVPKDLTLAAECFRKGHDWGLLGEAYFHGAGVPRDLTQARTFLMREPTHDPALLVRMYREGLGGPRDPVRVYAMALNHDLPEPLPPFERVLASTSPAKSWLELGRALLRKNRMASALLAFRKAAGAGSREAKLRLGLLYLRQDLLYLRPQRNYELTTSGFGIAEDIPPGEALAWGPALSQEGERMLRGLAMAGYGPALHALNSMVAPEGPGLSLETQAWLKKIHRFERKSPLHPDAPREDALLELSRKYREGNGVPQDPVRGLYYVRMAEMADGC